MNFTIFSLVASSITSPMFMGHHRVTIFNSRFTSVFSPLITAARVHVFRSNFARSTSPIILSPVSPYTITDSTILNHTAITGDFYASLDVASSTFTNCTSDTEDGGAISVARTLDNGGTFPVTITGSTFTGCVSRKFDGHGGAIFLGNVGTVKVERCCFTRCLASDGVFLSVIFSLYFAKYTSDVSVLQCTFAKNTDGSRVGQNSVSFLCMKLLVTDVNVSRNSVSSTGAAFKFNVERELAVSRTLADNNTGSGIVLVRGGTEFFRYKYNSVVRNKCDNAIQLIGTYLLEECVFNNPEAVSEIAVSDGDVTLKSCVFSREIESTKNGITLINSKVDAQAQPWGLNGLNMGECVVGPGNGKIPDAVTNKRGIFADYITTVADIISFCAIGIGLFLLLLIGLCVLYNCFCAKPSLFAVRKALRTGQGGDIGAHPIEDTTSEHPCETVEANLGPVIVEGKVDFPMGTLHESDMSSNVELHADFEVPPPSMEPEVEPPSMEPEVEEPPPSIESGGEEPPPVKKHRRRRRRKTKNESSDDEKPKSDDSPE